MAISTDAVSFEHDGTTLEMMVAHAADAGPRPAVLVSHAWGGRDDFVVDKARELAGLGYTGVAMDMYGKGVLGSGPEENQALMQPLVGDRGLLRARLLRNLAVAREHPAVDAARVAAMGYCFGGLCVLDLARAGADVAGVISIHGLLNAPEGLERPAITAKALVLHGWDDPMVPPEQVLAFASEMTGAGADWQLHAYGHALHAFTTPGANDPGLGVKYDATADGRATAALQHFLSELFA